MPEQTKEEEHPDDPMMTRFEPVNVDDWSSRTVSALSPTNLTLLGNVQVAFIWMMDAGSKTVMGTEFDARIPENGLLLQFCDPATASWCRSGHYSASIHNPTGWRQRG